MGRGILLEDAVAGRRFPGGMLLDLFDLGRKLHSLAGTLAQAAFWVAALAAKGGMTHRRAGKIYLRALLGVLALSTLMVAGKAVQGDAEAAIFLAFLISMVGTASWLMWFAIRYRRDPERLVGGLYRSLASWLLIAGGGVFVLGLRSGRPLMMFLSLLGVGFGANMWRLALARDRSDRFWLAQHMNGATLNFIATHDSFIALGIGSVVPELRQPVSRMLVAAGVTVTALLLRSWLGKRHLRGRAGEARAGETAVSFSGARS